MKIVSKVYAITKEQCQAQIDKKENGVCPGCGGQITPLETVNNSGEPTYWAGCEHCQVFTYPVDKMIFDIADRVVKDGSVIRYNRKPYQATEEDLEYWLDTERRGVCEYVSTIFRTKALLEKGE